LTGFTDVEQLVDIISVAMPTMLGKEIGPNGFGLMGMTWRTNPPPEEQSYEAMREALANGSNFWK
jgi:pyridoxine 4-dehydrogenase